MYRFKRFTEKAGVALNLAINAAREMGHTYVGTEHLVLGLLREGTGVAATVLMARGVTALTYARKIMEVESGGSHSDLSPDDMTPRALVAMESALAEAAMAQQRLAGTEHILAAILRDDTGVAVRLLQQMGVRAGDMLSDLTRAAGGHAAPAPEGYRTNGRNGRTPLLDQYGKDLTAMAVAGDLDPVVGREEEIRRVIQILCRRTKNNPCLIGEPGVGKTAIAEGLAARIVAGTVPDSFRGKRVVALDLTGMVAGTKYRGDFEERVKNAIREVQQAGDILLFIDEIHNLIGTGAAEGAVDAANILKPLLARGDLQLIGATTVEEYRRHIERDAALERRFQPVTVAEPDEQQTLTILRSLRSRYEGHHRVHLTEEAMQAAVRLAVRYIPDRYLPDKAVDLMDEAAARVRLRNAFGQSNEEMPALPEQTRQALRSGDLVRAATLHKDCKRLQSELKPWCEEDEGITPVTAADVEAVAALWTGIPLEQLSRREQERLQHLEEHLHRRMVGQEAAVSAVARAVRRGRVGLQDPDRPAGSFIFLGPTGVGKTALCKALAEALFGDEKALIRLDMSEYMEKHTVSRLIGSPPGYVGHDEGGLLVEQVRRHPYAVVLFDEVEKAHPDVFNLLLQILEDGRLTDTKGRRADFRNALVVMTSNVGARQMAGDGRLGFADGSRTATDGARHAIAMGELKKLFRPELLGRVDEIIVFRSLSPEEVEIIVGRMLEALTKRVEALGYHCQIEPQVASVLAKEGYDPVYGARPLRRVLQTRVEDVLAEQLLEGRYRQGDTITVTVVDGAVCCGRMPHLTGS